MTSDEPDDDDDDAHEAAVEEPAGARATRLKQRDAMTTPLMQTMAFGIGM